MHTQINRNMQLKFSQLALCEDESLLYDFFVSRLRYFDPSLLVVAGQEEAY